MTANLSPHSALEQLTAAMNEAAGMQLKILLETKHLYQKVNIDPRPLVANFRTLVNASVREQFDKIAQELLATIRFMPSSGKLTLLLRGEGAFASSQLMLTNVSLYCTTCDRREVFTPIFYQDAANEILKLRMLDARLDAPPAGFQLFFLTYQCQRCKAAPEGIIVRRQDWNLYLEGRSPIEHVELPAFIPKQERSFFRDAIVAAQSGKILAGLFYLRTFIEQFGRRQMGIKGKATGDDILAAYSEKLPADQRGQMPSLKSCYEQLSIALHAAKEDSELFEKVRAEIEKHFDIRRVFQIPDHIIAAGAATTTGEKQGV